MQQKTIWQSRDRWGLPVLCLLLFVLNLVLFTGKLASLTAILAAGAAIYLLITQDLRPLRSPLGWPLFAYVVFAGLAALWAIAGKFQLREYRKIFIAAAICLFILLKPRFDRSSARRVSALIAGTAALSAFLSVEGGTTGLTAAIFGAIPEFMGISLGFQTGNRLYGVFGNPNFEISVFAFGIFFSIALLCGEETRRERVLHTAALSFCAYALLLGFSMGGMACFALSILFYLIFAGDMRSAALIRMLEAAVPTLLFVMLAFPFFNRPGFPGVLPLLIMLLNAAFSALLELRVAPKLTETLEAHRKLAFGVLLGVIALAAVYVIAAVSVHGAYTFGGSLSRSVYPERAGESVLNVEADGDVTVTILSRNRAQIISSGADTLYSGPADGARFDVPEHSELLVFTFSGAGGTTLHSASVNGSMDIPLSYPLLPAFAANRIQGIRTNTNFTQRIVFMQDGLKLWRMSPVVGLGVGAFENGLVRVQEFPYRTRYVHSHYVQILLETGVIGLAFWVGALVAMGVALWLRRKERAEEYLWLYGALWAALLMVATQSAVDVSLSFIGFLCYAYAAFGMILRLYAAAPEPIVEEETAKKKKNAAHSEEKGVSLGRIVLAMLPFAFAVSLALNLWAQDILHKEVPSLEQFFGNAALAAKIDAYEYNDAKLSYLTQSVAYDVSAAVREQADVYAEELSHEQSNSLPLQLTAYYLDTSRFEKAIDAALLGAVYCASDSSTWNRSCEILRDAFGDTVTSPLLVDGAELVQKLLSYRAALDAHNATAIVPVELTEENAAFLDKVARLDPYPDDIYKVAEILGS